MKPPDSDFMWLFLCHFSNVHGCHKIHFLHRYQSEKHTTMMKNGVIEK